VATAILAAVAEAEPSRLKGSSLLFASDVKYCTTNQSINQSLVSHNNLRGKAQPHNIRGVSGKGHGAWGVRRWGLGGMLLWETEFGCYIKMPQGIASQMICSYVKSEM